jgi:putative Mn2+ efflux pump MntP
MTIFNIFGVAVALAMDAFAVSIAAGICLEKLTNRNMFRLWWHFGLFQALMLIIGWAAGLTIRGFIEQFDHWVAFGLLAFVGGGMIRNALKTGEECLSKDPTRGSLMVMLSIATSLDAMAVGLGLSVINISIWMPALIVGLTAAIFTSVGLHIGAKAVKVTWVKKYAELAGGLVLFLIGFRILWEHQALSFIG